VTKPTFSINDYLYLNNLKVTSYQYRNPNISNLYMKLAISNHNSSSSNLR